MRKWLETLLNPRLVLIGQVAKLRAELSLQEGRFEAIEQRLADLADRFNRFQNRHNMRSAREAVEVDDTLLEEARALLARSEPAAVPLREKATDKRDLWKMRRQT